MPKKIYLCNHCNDSILACSHREAKMVKVGRRDYCDDCVKIILSKAEQVGVVEYG